MPLLDTGKGEGRMTSNRAAGWGLVSAVALLLATAPATFGQGGGPKGFFRTEVPAHPVSLILGRPTRESVTVSVLASTDMVGFVR